MSHIISSMASTDLKAFEASKAMERKYNLHGRIIKFQSLKKQKNIHKLARTTAKFIRLYIN